MRSKGNAWISHDLFSSLYGDPALGLIDSDVPAMCMTLLEVVVYYSHGTKRFNSRCGETSTDQRWLRNY